MGKVREWLLKLFTSNTGISFSRVASAIITAFVLGWDTSYVVVAFELRKSGVDVPLLPPAQVFLAQTGFMTAFYLGNKTTAALRDGKTDGDSNAA